MNDLNDGIQRMFFKKAANPEVERLQALQRAELLRTLNIPVKLEHTAPTEVSENHVFQIKGTGMDI